MSTNKTDVYHRVEIWSLDMLDLKVYGPENNRNYRYVLVILDNFSKFGWTLPLRKKIAQTIKDASEVFLISSRRKPNLKETDRGKEFSDNIFQDFLKKTISKFFSRINSVGAVFAERYIRTKNDLLRRPVPKK